jgi:hypothetical protein
VKSESDEKEVLRCTNYEEDNPMCSGSCCIEIPDNWESMDDEDQTFHIVTSGWMVTMTGLDEGIAAHAWCNPHCILDFMRRQKARQMHESPAMKNILGDIMRAAQPGGKSAVNMSQEMLEKFGMPMTGPAAEVSRETPRVESSPKPHLSMFGVVFNDDEDAVDIALNGDYGRQVYGMKGESFRSLVNYLNECAKRSLEIKRRLDNT